MSETYKSFLNFIECFNYLVQNLMDVRLPLLQESHDFKRCANVKVILIFVFHCLTVPTFFAEDVDKNKPSICCVLKLSWIFKVFLLYNFLNNYLRNLAIKIQTPRKWMVMHINLLYCVCSLFLYILQILLPFNKWANYLNFFKRLIYFQLTLALF